MAATVVCPRNAAPLQGGPAELEVSLADPVSYTSTDPTMGQELLYLTKVRAHSREYCDACFCCRYSCTVRAFDDVSAIACCLHGSSLGCRRC